MTRLDRFRRACGPESAAHRFPDASPLRGRAALVTGSSRGLGLLIARTLADRGCSVMLCARRRADLAAAEGLLRARGADVASLACDVTEDGVPERLAEAVRDRFGGLDVLVNNAGIIQVGPLAAMTEEDFRAAMETMFFAPLRLTLSALPWLCEAPGGGRLVNITSIGGRIAPPHLLPYAAAKFAAAGLSEGLRAELAAEGVSVTTVVPGLMRTGSHTAAEFCGDPPREYAWFAAAAAMPLLSANAERAARAIVRGAERRRPEVVITPAAKAAVRLHGVAPATTARLMSLAARLLPRPDGEDGGADADSGAAGAGRGDGAWRHRMSGTAATRRLDSALIDRLTTLNDRAAGHFNQPPRNADGR